MRTRQQPDRRRSQAEVAGRGLPASHPLVRLQQTAGNRAVTAMVALQRDCIPGHMGTPHEDWRKDKDSAHLYEQEFLTCSKGSKNCTVPRVLQAVRRNPAPGAPGTTEVSTGDQTTVTGLGPVQHTVDESSATVLNTTTPAHRLHSGEVRIQVVERGDGIYARYTGYGTGPMGWMNTWMSLPVWGYQHSKVKKDVTKDK